MKDDYAILVTFGIYLILMLLAGWYFFTRTKDLSDYILGGRSLNAWVTSLSAQASDMSGWLLMGLPGLAYTTGLGSIWIAAGLLAGAYLNWKAIAKRLRKYTFIAGNALTLPDYFQNRFKTADRTLKTVSALFILIFFLIYTASGFVAGAKLFQTVFETSYVWALTIGAVTIILYTLLGGFMAVAWTDFVQGTIMFAAIIAVPAIGIFSYGGIGKSYRALEELGMTAVFSGGGGEALSFIAIASLLAWGLGYFGQPHILVRFMAIRHSSQIRPARRIAIIWTSICLVCAVAIGMLGNILLERPLQPAEVETVYIELVERHLNPWFAGVALSAILAAIMSTADSQLLVSSSALTEDLYRAFIRRNATQRELIWIGRLSVALIAVFAFAIALNPESSVLELVAYAWGGFGAAFGPLIILSLFWSRMTYKGAVAGVVAGGITVLVWKQLHGGIFELYEIAPGFLFSALSIVLVSLLDKEPPQSVRDEFHAIAKADV